MRSLLQAAAILMVLCSAQALAKGDAAAGQGKSAICAACHNIDGNSTVPNWPKLAGQHAAYLERQISLIKDGSRAVPEMAGIAGALMGSAYTLLLTLLLSFTGYLLPWDQLALWAVAVGTNMMGYTPVFGKEVRFVLLGGAEIGAEGPRNFRSLHFGRAFPPQGSAGDKKAVFAVHESLVDDVPERRLSTLLVIGSGPNLSLLSPDAGAQLPKILFRRKPMPPRSSRN